MSSLIQNIDSILIFTTFCCIVLFFISISLFIIFKRQKKTFHKKIEALKKNKELLRINQETINEISRTNNLDSLIQKSIIHITKSDIYKFDYIMFSFIDFKSREIKTYDITNWEGNSNQINIKWISKSSYPIDNVHNTEFPDILQRMIQPEVNEPVYVIGNNVVENKFGIDKNNLNKEIFNEQGHEYYARVFIPIIHRNDNVVLSSSNSKDSEKLADFDLGVIEAGYNTNNKIVNDLNVNWNPKKEDWNSHKFKHQYFGASKIQNLFLYTDNFAQLYYKNFLAKKKEEIRNSVRNFESIDYKDFLKETLEYICELMSTPFGHISILDFKNPIQVIEKTDTRVGYSLSGKEVSDINKKLLNQYSENQAILGLCNKTLSTGKTVLNNDIQQNDKTKSFLRGKNKIHAEICVPLRSPKNNIIGALILSSPIQNFFNQIHKELIEYAGREIAVRYLTLKNITSLKKLNSPINTFNQKGLTDKLIIDVADYFNTNEILLWTRKQEDTRKNQFLLEDQNFNDEIYKKAVKIGLNAINDIPKSEEFIGENVNLGFQDNDKAILVRLVSELKSNSILRDFCKESGYKSVIILRIPSNDIYGHILTIFSRINLSSELVDELASSFILSYRERFVNSLQRQTLTGILINNEYNEQKNIVKLIVESAFSLLNATVVGFTPINGNKLDYKNSYIIGKMWQEFGDGDLLLSESIIKSGNDHYLLSKEQIEKFITHKIKRDSFLDKANIQSVAGIKLENKNVLLGVLMIEFNKKNAITPEKKQLIESIKNISEKLLFNYSDLEKRINRFKKLHDEADLKIKNSQDEQKKLRKDRDELTELIMELRILGAAAGYFDIFRIVNHEIHNYFVQFDYLLNKENINLNTKRTIEDIKEMIISLIEMFNSGNTHKQFFDINTIIKRLVALNKKSYEDIVFDISKLDNTIPNLKWNKAQFSIIIYNLINNAVYALRHEGNNKEVRKMEFKTCLTDEDVIVITVKDNGIGIKKDDLDKIYDLKFTTKGEEGQGIGLHFIKNSLFNEENEYSADITCKSVYGEYTEFTITIPKYLNYK